MARRSDGLHGAIVIAAHVCGIGATIITTLALTVVVAIVARLLRWQL